MIGIPTETVYGLAANALDANAVIKIFETKKRPTFDPLIVHIANAEHVLKYATEFPSVAQRLTSKLWPGPLTVLLPKRDLVPDLVTSGLPRVALRVPNHPLTHDLLERLAFPLAAPSANPFGYISPTTAQHVVDQLGSSVPFVLEGGPCSVGVESTIVGFEEVEGGGGNEVVVYRLGGVSVEDLTAAAGEGVSIRVSVNNSSNPAAPGMLKSHYAPRKPLILLDGDDEIPSSREVGGQRVGLISVVSRDVVSSGVAVSMSLTQDGSLAEAAKNLFATLRAMDASDVDIIYAQRCKDEGLGRAINDRLQRASVKE